MWLFCWYQYLRCLSRLIPTLCVCVCKGLNIWFIELFTTLLSPRCLAHSKHYQSAPLDYNCVTGTRVHPTLTPLPPPTPHTHPWHSSPFLCSFVCANNSRTTLHVKWTFDLTCPKPNFVLIQQNHSTWNWKEFPEWVAALPVVVGNAIQCWYTA